MPSKSLHDKPFDESTCVKLTLFESYAQAWLPKWIMSGAPQIHIFDLFAGVGYDKADVPGSSIRLLRKIQEQLEHIEQNGTRVVLHLNEYEPGLIVQKNAEQLRSSVSAYLDARPRLGRAVKIEFYNEDCAALLPRVLYLMRMYPSLVLLDQNGIKFFSYIPEFADMRQTDLLVFAAASFIRRFGREDVFQKHLGIDIGRLSEVEYKLIHRELVIELNGAIPAGSELRLFPFSLKKESNIYGVIFGGSHPAAFDAFLDIAWKLDPRSGDANFDIENESAKAQGHLFEPNLTKREAFGLLLIDLVLSEKLQSNKEVLDFCNSQGHPGNHAHPVLLSLKKDGKIVFDGRSPKVNYRQVYRDRNMLRFTVVK
jgi:three-Cys-motif partner protein